MSTPGPARAVALEATGLLTGRPTGVAVYGRGLVRALVEETASEAHRRRFRLICPASRWPRRAAVRDLGLAVAPYFSGRCLPRSTSLVHLLDTRCPTSYDGPLVATVFDTISALPISEELGLSSETFRRKKLRAYREIAARADVVITLAAAVKHEMLARFPETRRVEVIRPGVDVPDASRLAVAHELLRDYGIRPPFLLAAGALCPRKNIETIVAVYDRAHRTRPDLQLVLAGAPDYAWTGSAGERAVRSSTGRVHLPGYLPRAVLWAAFAKARCVLQLSHYEGFGLTVLEALAAGAPVIASRRGGLPEAADDLAWLVEPDDVEAATGALERVLAGGPAVTEACRRGRLYGRALTWRRAARSVLRLYDEVLAGRG